MTVRQLLSGLDSRELTEWVAYFNLSNPAKETLKAMPLGDQIKKALKGRKRKA